MFLELFLLSTLTHATPSVDVKLLAPHLQFAEYVIESRNSDFCADRFEPEVYGAQVILNDSPYKLQSSYERSASRFAGEEGCFFVADSLAHTNSERTLLSRKSITECGAGREVRDSQTYTVTITRGRIVQLVEEPGFRSRTCSWRIANRLFR